MKISHIEHLGIAVKSNEEALPYNENVLGLKCYNIETVEDQKVKTAFLKVGDVKIELLEPTSPESTISKFIEKNELNIEFAQEFVQPLPTEAEPAACTALLAAKAEYKVPVTVLFER